VCPHAYGREHRTWWKAALKESKVRDFHWHDIRHTFASRLVMGVVDIYTVKELMGHAVISVTQRYAHISRPAVCRPSWILLPFHQVSQKAHPPLPSPRREASKPFGIGCRRKESNLHALAVSGF